MAKFELKTAEGKYKTTEELLEEAKDQLVDELTEMGTDDAIRLGNEIRNDKGYDFLYRNREDELNEALEDESPYDILNLGWDDYDDFFVFDGCDLTTTDDVWYDLDVDDIADEILVGEYFDNLPEDLQEFVKEYQKAKETLENLNPYREEGRELLNKYANGKADAQDLLLYIDRLVKTDDVWKEGK